MKEKQHSLGGGAPRRRRSAQVARREILDAAQQRLSQGGPDAIRLQEIANDVGISHPTILHHFGSRDGLIRALDVRAIHALTDDIARMIQEDRDPDAAGVDLVERVAETMDKEGLARLIAWWAMRDFDAAEAESVAPAELVQNVSKLIRDRLLQSEEISPGSHETVSFGVRLAVVAMFGDALIGDVMSPVPPDDREAERHRFREWLVSTLRAGLATGTADSETS